MSILVSKQNPSTRPDSNKHSTDWSTNLLVFVETQVTRNFNKMSQELQIPAAHLFGSAIQCQSTIVAAVAIDEVCWVVILSLAGLVETKRDNKANSL